MKKKKCIFTYLYNEPVFFPLWLKYYSEYFCESDIYVLHGTKQQRTDFDSWLEKQTGFFRVPLPDNELQSDWDFNRHQLKMVKLQQTCLLFNYEYVLYTDVDEIIYHPAGLDNYINTLTVDMVTCNGFELVQVRGEEPDIDLLRPIMQQRKWWHSSDMYSKPLLARNPMNWCAGFHHINHWYKPPVDPNLYLVHLHRMDFSVALARNFSRCKNKEEFNYYSQVPDNIPGYQNSLGQWALESIWNGNFDLGRPADQTEIPEFIRNGIHI